MRRRFTGWHMAGVLIGGFGIVFAVNILMASMAVGSFGGVVVENSYVASQKFNDWLAKAKEANELGWSASISRDGEGHLIVATEGTPPGIAAQVELRHPLGRSETIRWQLEPGTDGRFTSTQALPEGRWLVRLTLSGEGREMRIERPVG